MKIQDKDLYHGASLTQIVEHNSFKALNKVDDKYGHYLVNTDIRLLVKYSKKKQRWQFTFQPDDLKTLTDDLQGTDRVFACLVCGRATVCLLDDSQLKEVMDLGARSAQTVSVRIPKNASMRVKGTKGSLSSTIPHNAFPNPIFG